MTRGVAYESVPSMTRPLPTSPRPSGSPQTTPWHVARGALYDVKALLYQLKGDRDRAVQDWTDAIRLDPKQVGPYLSLGTMYANQGDHVKAIAEFTKAIRLEPRCAAPMSYAATAIGRRGDVDRAIADLTEAIRLDPKYGDAYWERGLAYKKKGDKTKADADFARAKGLGHEDVANDSPSTNLSGHERRPAGTPDLHAERAERH